MFHYRHSVLMTWIADVFGTMRNFVDCGLNNREDPLYSQDKTAARRVGKVRERYDCVHSEWL
jgi:hypothetical protein